MKRGIIVILLSGVILFSLYPVFASPNVTFNSQNPSDLDLTNFLGPDGVNITYNITYNISTLDLSYSTIHLYFKSNSTRSNIQYYQNGTEHSGYFSMTYTSNSSELFVWKLTDNYVLPATYNYGEITLENTIHSSAQLTANTQYASIEFLNVSNSTQYSFFEIMTNRSSGTGGLRAYYCNSSYSTGNPAGSANCYNFYTLTNNTYHHSHSTYSNHMLLPFTINESSGKVGSIIITPTSYFLIRGQSGSTWNFYYITNSSRANAFKTSANSGGSWTSQTYTIDAHLHQFGTNTSLWYYVCANDTSDNQNCTSPKQDLFELAGLPPTSPSVYSPTNKTYYKNQGNISINYSAASSLNSYEISFYNISLMNINETFNQTIITNNSNILYYSWNASSIPDGDYEVRVEACDIYNQCSAGFSENFTIATLDTIYPIFSNYLDNNASLSGSGTAWFNVTILNSNGTVFLEINNTNITATNLTAYVYNASYDFTINGTYSYRWHSWGNGSSNNYNTSDTKNYFVNPVATETASESSDSGFVECKTNWTCTAWSACVNGTQNRTCTKEKKYCYADIKKKPAETQNCSIKILEENKDYSPNETIAGYSSEIQSGKNNNALIFKYLVLGIIAILIIGSVLFLLSHKHFKKRKYRHRKH